MVPVTLAAGEENAFWYDARGHVGHSIFLNVTITGAGVLNVRGANDDAATHAISKDNVNIIGTASVTGAYVLPAPLPNFYRFKNVGLSGTVVYDFSAAPQDATNTPAPTA